MLHTLVALVEDKPGVLNRVASLIRRRGFNIVSLAVGKSELPGKSRMTFVVKGDQGTVDQVTSQLHKLIDVIRVGDISREEMVARELALIKVHATPANRGEIIQVVQLFRASIVDVGALSMIIEVTGEEDKIDALYSLLHSPFSGGRIGLWAFLLHRPSSFVNNGHLLFLFDICLEVNIPGD